MYFIEIEDRRQIIGYVLLDLTQKRFVPNSVFPLLVNENLYSQQVEGSEQFSYGVFNKQGEFSMPGQMSYSIKVCSSKGIIIRHLKVKGIKL